MRISLRPLIVISAGALALAACAQPAPPPAPVAPEGAMLEGTNTVQQPDGSTLTTYTYRLPDQLLTNGPQCTRGDPQCP